jgi:CheY-like chemotaxis protein
MKILIAEDSFSDRLILKKIIEGQGHEVIEAENGVQALEVCQNELPDLVLLDALMPKLDGFEVARQLKQQYDTHYLPIIFITSLNDPESLVKCIDSGGDDFFIKPFNRTILAAKINAFQRTKDLYQTVSEQKQKIEYHTQHLLQEQRVAKRIFDNIAHKGALDEPYIRYEVSPMSVFNGDILLAAKRPQGGLNVFLGDFTGHGLAAAIGAMPASDIFFRMTTKGFELYEIVQEMNTRLNSILPTGFFCCAAAAEIDFEGNCMKFINCGLPDAYIIDRNTGEVDALSSTHLPLGILSNDKLNIQIELLPFKEGASLFLCSDGVIEAENDQGEMFGQERLLVALCEGAAAGDAFGKVHEYLKPFHRSREQADDVTYIEVRNHKEFEPVVFHEVDEVFSKAGPSDSTFSLSLGPHSLRNFNPLPVLTQHLMEIGNLRSYRTQILTILTELYSNALEHGVLGLSSSMKKSAHGFAEYYRLREQRLEQLQDGYINISVSHFNESHGGRLEIIVEDSGKGFNYHELSKKASEQGLSGRGYLLIYRLADSLEFSNNGSRVKVIFSWIARRNNDL